MSGQAGGGAHRFGQQQLGRTQAGQLGAQLAEHVRAGELGDFELPGGDVGVGHTGVIIDHQRTGQIVVAVAAQQAGLDDRAGRDHADHFPPHQALPGHLTDLLADGHMVAFFDQPGQVVLDRVVGNAGHWHPGAFGHVARGEHDVQFPGGEFRVLVKRLVEIAQTEKHDRVRVLPFDIQILLANGGDVLRHTRHSK